MPLGGSLPSADIALVRAWIDNVGSGSSNGSTSDSNDSSDASTTSTSGTTTPTLSSLQTNIFTPRCSGCHSGSGSSLPGAMDLSAGSTFGATVSQPAITGTGLTRIAPNDPAGSLLYRKIAGTQTGGEGGRMPQSGCCLTTQQIADVEAWINAGAQDN